MKKLLISGAAAALVASSLVIVPAFADNDKGEHFRKAHELGSTLEIHVNDNGQVLVRGAKVTAVNGTTINAATVWGNVSLSWAVNTNANTEFVRKAGGASNINEVSTGDFVSFRGRLVTTGTNSLVVDAAVVKNWSASAQVGARVFEGSLKSIAGTTAPTTLVVSIDGIDHTINVPANISILNELWLSTSLASFRVGDRIRLYGVRNGTTINATVVRDVSIR